MKYHECLAFQRHFACYCIEALNSRIIPKIKLLNCECFICAFSKFYETRTIHVVHVTATNIHSILIEQKC